jgi:hypothetical protein
VEGVPGERLGNVNVVAAPGEIKRGQPMDRSPEHPGSSPIQELNMNKAKKEKIPKKINPIDLVQEQYQHLKEKLRSATDLHEKQVIFRRLVNLIGVMQFLLSVSKNS